MAKSRTKKHPQRITTLAIGHCTSHQFEAIVQAIQSSPQYEVIIVTNEWLDDYSQQLLSHVRCHVIVDSCSDERWRLLAVQKASGQHVVFLDGRTWPTTFGAMAIRVLVLQLRKGAHVALVDPWLAHQPYHTLTSAQKVHTFINVAMQQRMLGAASFAILPQAWHMSALRRIGIENIAKSALAYAKARQKKLKIQTVKMSTPLLSEPILLEPYQMVVELAEQLGDRSSFPDNVRKREVVE